MYTATTQITITQFVPITQFPANGNCTQATISPPVNTSPQPPNQKTPVFTGDGQSITITVPQGYQGGTQLTYQLFDPQYVLLGLAFKGPIGGAGREEFNQIDVYRDTTSSQIIVTDTCDPKFSGVEYQYVILIQEVATGAIGMIDPDIETDINK
ncbi:hypothetical protein [Oleiharenicola sp. Vm1]|uniref:hypothetical protein n=1 Tax=Oleiharenicola sp. Vm1 TaxID=3398393 RepID=UPI0039F4B22B